MYGKALAALYPALTVGPDSQLTQSHLQAAKCSRQLTQVTSHCTNTPKLGVGQDTRGAQGWFG
jgi:hypothetical protein